MNFHQKKYKLYVKINKVNFQNINVKIQDKVI